MLTVICNGKDITGMIAKVEWSGQGAEVARKCDLTYANAPYDPNVKDLPSPQAGDYVTVTDSEDGELFYGRVEGSEKGSTYGTLTANCIEDSQFLVKSKVKYSFTNKTPEEITALILKDFEFPVGNLASTGVNIKSFVADGTTIYDAIKNAYAEATKQTHEYYLLTMRGRALNVEVSGSRVTSYKISEKTNITESHYSEKTDSVINKVVIYDQKGDRVGEVTNAGSMGKYGTYQEIYKATDNDKDVKTAASAMLKDPEQSLSVSALGDNSCTSGCGIILEDSATEQYGLYWIKNDTHTYENGNHTMQLELSFKKITSGDTT